VHAAIDWNPFAWRHEHGIADFHVREWDANSGASSPDGRHSRQQVEQGPM
jgi:hypothetical protein